MASTKAEGDAGYVFQWRKMLLSRNHVGQRLSASTQALAHSLATYADGKTGRRAHPGNQRLERDTGFSKATVKRALSELTAAECVAVVSASNGRGGKATEYRLTLPSDWSGRCKCSLCDFRAQDVTPKSSLSTQANEPVGAHSADIGAHLEPIRAHLVTPISTHTSSQHTSGQEASAEVDEVESLDWANPPLGALADVIEAITATETKAEFQQVWAANRRAFANQTLVGIARDHREKLQH